MSTETLVQSILTSLVIPLLLTTVKQYKLSGKVKFVLSLVTVFSITLVLTIISNGDNLTSVNQVIDQFLLTFILTEANYKLWFKQSLFEAYLEQVLGIPKTEVENIKVEQKSDLGQKDNAYDRKS